jgi:hypothetical protein
MSASIRSVAKSLDEIPEPCPSTSMADVLSLSHGTCFVMYEVNTSLAWRGRRFDPNSVALVRLSGVRHLLLGGPNDEALHRHPYFSLGLEHYTMHEVTNSPWCALVSSQVDKDGRTDQLRGCRHFVFALKETCIDAIATQIEFCQVFSDRKTGRRALAMQLAVS